MPAKIRSYWETMRVNTKEEADQMIERLILQAIEEQPTLNVGEARAIQLSNIGYFFGYLTPDERARVMPLYPDAAHPIYGRFDENYSVESMLSAGMAMGKSMQEGETTSEAILKAREELKKKK